MSQYVEQYKTLADVREKLAAYHKCAIIRPTGFGKTYLMTELIREYAKVLYLYPSAVIRDTVVGRYYELESGEDVDISNEEDASGPDAETIDTMRALKQIPNCTLMTYSKLIKLAPDELKSMGYDLILCDEMHRLGGARTKVAMTRLIKGNPDAYFVGATATPNRMDGFDVVSMFFGDVITYIYTLLDAINDGLIQKPNYCYCTYDIEADLTSECLTAGQDPNDPTVKSILDAKRIELAEIFGMPAIIKETCEQYAVDTDYMKFIVFFSSFAHMDEKLDEVVGWFREAYPHHTVNTLRITSRNRAERENTDRLSSLTKRPLTIDLIGCIDMLNVGYHVSDQTGIIMYRGTKSGTIFIQQLGRAMSAGAGNSAIVFDIVDNLHRKAVYELQYGRTVNRTVDKKPVAKLLQNYSISDKDNATVVFTDAQGNQVETEYYLNGNNDIVDQHGHQATLVYDMDTGNIYDGGGIAQTAITRVTVDCINATGHMATYRELLAKAVAEPMSQRCRYALELHFRTWCLNHHIPYPISKEDMLRLHGMNKEDFMKAFERAIRTNKIKYPLQDAKSLLSIGDDGSTDIPLRICAEAKNVSVSNILDMLGVKAG